MKTLEEIKGIGPKNRKLLNKLNIYNSDDLIHYYPFRYEILEKSNIEEIEDKGKIIIDGIVENNPKVYYISRKLDKMSFTLNTGSNLYNIVIFNRGFLKSKLVVGTEVTIIGTVDQKHHIITAGDIRFGKLLEPKIEPVYHTTYGLSSSILHKYILNCLKEPFDTEDYIPDELKTEYHFWDKKNSILELHHPTSKERLKCASVRMKYEELFLFMLKMNYLKNNKENKIGLSRIIDYSLVKEWIKKLPFSLTSDQLKSVDDIYHDLCNKKRMNRLLQGDVGSGKTIVAIISMYMNYLSGYQSALMAPTEILAIQHYQNMKKLFLDEDIKIGLLTGKLKAKEKKELLQKLETGEIDMIVGTHALISEDVKYKNLGLVITDEQHRFGVNQRGNLKNKGLTPDILYMSATPIPRTYALTLYGDMDISNIKTIPSGKKEIITTLKKENEIKDVLTAMLNELKQHHQIYVIAPLIEESEKIDLENVHALEEKMNKAFGKYYKIGVLHGKMNNEEKEEMMRQFEQNDIQILISTTVVEVGIDVKNATMIVIWDAFRYGLSTLHQLRGRVGRNDLQSYCILVSNRETERLKILTQTCDGFKISEEDFLLRGSGDLFGIKQSGDMVFQVADLKKDYKILLKAKEDSEKFLLNGGLEKYSKIKDLILSSMELD